MSTSREPLFETLELGPLTLPNRLVMAPMTRSRAASGNVPTALNARYCAQRASAGLIVSEATQVSPEGVGYLRTPGMYEGAQVEGWRLVTSAVHERGGRIFAQLWHVGRVSHPLLQPGGQAPVAPSAIGFEGTAHTFEGPKPYGIPRALELAEIPGVVKQFAEGARRAKAAGFDGVELHAANGYLPDQFLRSGSNKRADSYGGTVANRARFLLEVTDALVAVWGAPKVGVRLSPTATFNGMSDDNPAETFTHVARELAARGVTYLHVVEPVAASGPRITPLLREVFHGPIIANGGYSAETANQVIRDGHADLVSFGVPFLANPDLPERLAQKAPLNAPDRSTFYSEGERGYVDYPALGATI